MLTPLRRNLILDEIAKRGSVRVTALTETLGVSAATVRRDLTALAQAGKTTSVWGGALAKRADGTVPAQETRPWSADDAAIAALAGRELASAHVVGLFGTGPVDALAWRLSARRDLIVVTNRIEVATILGAAGTGFRDRIAVLPGVLSRTATLLGPMTIAALGLLRVDVAVFDCDGFDTAAGASVFDIEDAHVRSLAVRNSGRCLVLAGAARCGTVTLSAFARPWEVDLVISAAPGGQPSLHQHRTLAAAKSWLVADSDPPAAS
jgi:DeoR/GlpR family transcriptional regulator of sugar metabolism